MPNPFFERQQARQEEERKTEQRFIEPEVIDPPAPARPSLPQRLAIGPVGDTIESLLEGAATPVETAAGLATGVGTFLARIPFSLPQHIAALSGRQVTPQDRAPLKFFDENIAPFTQFRPQGKIARGIVETLTGPFEAAKRDLTGAKIPLTDKEISAEQAEALVDAAAIFGPKIVGKAAGATARFAKRLGERGSLKKGGPPLTTEDIAKIGRESELGIDAVERRRAAERKPAQPDGVTGIKNRVVDAELQAEGLPPATRGEKLSFEEADIKAEVILKKDPFAGKKLTEELDANPRPATGVEDALMVRDRNRLISERKSAEKALEEAGDESARDIAIARIGQAQQDFQLNSNAATKAGTESALSLGHRRMLMKEDFSLASLEQKKRTAGRGEALTPEQLAEVKEVSERIEVAQKTLDEKTRSFEERASVEQFERVREDLISEADSGTKPAPKKPTKPGKPEEGELDLFNEAQRLAREFIEKGVRERDPLVDAVQGELVKSFPELSRRETMDAISGYGRFTELSKDATSITLRDMKGQLQQVVKLEDIRSKKPLQKTGLERRTPSDAERRLIQEVNEAKRRFGVVVTDPATQLKSSLSALKTRLKNSISDLEFQISTRTKITKDRTATPRDAEAKALEGQVAVLKEQFQEIFGKPELTDAQRATRAEVGVNRSIANIELQLSGKKATVRGGDKISTPRLGALRARRDALRSELKEIQEAFNPKKTPEERALSSLKTRMRNQTAKLKERVSRGDFEPKERQQIPLDPEAQVLRIELEAAKDKFTEGLLKDILAKRSIAEKIFGASQETINLSRALITSLDLSAVLRQGGFIALANPVRAAKIFPDMIRAMSSAKAQSLIELQIRQRSNFKLYKDAGLFLSERRRGLVQMEEVYMARHVEKVPLVAASQRAYVTFLNRLRVDSFDAMVASLGKSGKVTLVEAKAIANFVNVATGRGAASARANAMIGLNTVFFAPRLVLSRFQLLTGQPFVRGSARTRTLVAQEYGKFLTGLAVVYTLGQLAGADVEFDPRSSDFGKMKFGNARVDPLTGLSQITVLTSRLASGETKSLRTGQVKELRTEGPKRFGAAGTEDVLARFLRSKLSPVVGAGVNILAGENVVGEQVTIESTITDLTTPLAMRDIYETMLDQGVTKGVALGMLSLLGMSLQTFDVTKKLRVDRRSFTDRMRDRLGLEEGGTPAATQNPFKKRAAERS